MNRLTKDNYDNDVFAYQKQTFIDKDGSRLHRSQYEYNNALWKYVKEQEDIEKELGIDLLIFLKMFTQENIYIKCNGEIFENDVEITINCDKKGYFINLDVCHFDPLYLKDYGKTWALTKEELL